MMKAIAISAVSVACLSTLVAIAAPHADEPAPIFPVTYPVGDLPVWRTNDLETEFAPDVLVEHLRSTVDPESWNADAELRVDKADACLIITQTKANHRAIARVINSFRPTKSREVEQRRTPPTK